MKVLPLMLLLALCVSACGDDNPFAPSAIVNKTWKLETIERTGTATITVPNPDLYTLRLEDDNRLAIRTDCNSCSGRYELNGDSLTFSNLACTLAFCGASSLDASFSSALNQVRSVTISGQQLVISGNGFTLRFRS